jgi:branched-chain amino acid transport system permease protein
MYQFINTILIGITSGAIYSLMATALVLVWRSARVVNFAQAGQALLSTYIGYEFFLVGPVSRDDRRRGIFGPH